MTVHLRHTQAKLTLPIMPPRRAPGDPRNYQRWHCWVEAVRELAAYYKDEREKPARRRR